MIKYLFFVLCVFSSIHAYLCNRPERYSNEPFPMNKNDRDSLRVVSYNIRGEHAIDKKHGNSWAIRKGKIGSLLRNYDPDIIALQGVCRHYLPDLHDLFRAYHCFCFEIQDKEIDIVLLVRKERLKIKSPSYFWLSENHCGAKQLPLLTWGEKMPRMVIYCGLEDITTHKAFMIFNTHFDSSGMKSRLNSAQLIADQLARLAKYSPAILAGDFNFIMENPLVSQNSQWAYDFIIGTEFKDVRDLCDMSYGPDGTWIGWRYDKYAAPANRVGERLDHLFVKEFCVLREGVLQVKTSPQRDRLLYPSEDRFVQQDYASDHLPVIADIVFK